MPGPRTFVCRRAPYDSIDLQLQPLCGRRICGALDDDPRQVGRARERSIDDVLVRVALDQEHRPDERSRTLLDPLEDVHEPRVRLVREEESVRLHQEHDTARVVLVRDVEGIVDPVHGRGDSRARLGELLGRCRCESEPVPGSEVVPRAHDMERCEDGLRLHPEDVLRIAGLSEHLLLPTPERDLDKSHRCG